MSPSAGTTDDRAARVWKSTDSGLWTPSAATRSTYSSAWRSIDVSPCRQRADPTTVANAIASTARPDSAAFSNDADSSLTTYHPPRPTTYHLPAGVDIGHVDPVRLRAHHEGDAHS